MPMNRINHAAAIVGAVAYFVWGSIWFMVFGKQWLALLNRAPGVMPGGTTPYVIAVLMALVLSYGTAIALSHNDERTAAHGVQFGIFMGIAFVASNMLTGFEYEGRPIGLWLIDAGYVVIGMAIVGAIIGGWKKRPAAAPPS